MHRKLVFVLTMFAVAIGSLSQAQAALASPRLPARVASAAHAWTSASITTHSATGAVRAAAARRPMAHDARLRTEEKQGSLPLGGDRRATQTSLGAQEHQCRLPLPRLRSPAPTHATFTVGQAGTFTVTTTGSLPMILSETPGAPPLPSGVTFRDNRNGTATLSGTPAAGTDGNVHVHDHRHEPGPSFYRYPELHPHGQPGVPDHQLCRHHLYRRPGRDLYRHDRPGCPTCTLSETGALPSGVTFTDNGDGTATLSGTPAAGTGGTYPFTITATNGVSPAATQSFTLTVHRRRVRSPALPTPPSPSARPGPLPSRRLGCPRAQLSETGALPSGVTFTDNGDGTATLSGTPAADTGGTYTFTITATNVAGYTTQSFTLTVNQACKITSVAPTTTFIVGFAWPSTVTFTVTSTGWPTCALSATGLPSGITFTDNGDGTGTFSGTPTAPGTHLGHDHCHERCRFYRHPDLHPHGQPGTGVYDHQRRPRHLYRRPGRDLYRHVDRGAHVHIVGDGRTAAGSHVHGQRGRHRDNLGNTGCGLRRTIPGHDHRHERCQLLTPPRPSPSRSSRRARSPALPAPPLPSARPGPLPSTSTGVPTCTLSETGALPPGVTFTDNGDGTATISGTPAAGSGGPYPVTITATNGVSPDATQTFTLTVNQACQITSDSEAAFEVGQARIFTVTSTGWPTCALSESRNLPPGVTFTDNGDGTATISGTPTTGGVHTVYDHRHERRRF